MLKPILLHAAAFAACLFVGADTIAGDTNGLFATTDRTRTSGTNGPVSHLADLDSLSAGPADKDPNGNWGPELGGMRLSLRFNKERYSPNDPITAIVLIRNTTNRVVRYPEIFGLGEHASICDFAVTDRKTHVLLEGKRSDTYFGSSRWSNLKPNQQDLFQVRLDRVFDFRPGTYSVKAVKAIPRADAASLELVSSTAELVIAGEQAEER